MWHAVTKEAWPTWILRQELKPALEVVQIGVGDLASELTCRAHHLRQTQMVHALHASLVMP